MDNNFFNDYFDEDTQEEEYERESERGGKKNGKTFTKGFVTALSICAVAVGAALWTTVNNVNSYLNPEVTVYNDSDSDTDGDSSATKSAVSSAVESEEEKQVNATVSTAKADSKTEKVVFNFSPINNKQVIQDYSEVPVFNSTLGDYRAHTGIDYEAEIDDKVRAMAGGVVKDIYCDSMLGNVVVVKHSESVESFYCGLAKTALVQMGDVVSAGDFLGTVYAIPGEAAEKAHVHIAVKENGKWVNPEKFMKSSEN